MSSAGGWSRTTPFAFLFLPLLPWCVWPWSRPIFRGWTWVLSSFFVLLFLFLRRFGITIGIWTFFRLRIMFLRLRTTSTSSPPTTWRIMPLLSIRRGTFIPFRHACRINFPMSGYVRWLWSIPMTSSAGLFPVNSPRRNWAASLSML